MDELKAKVNAWFQNLQNNLVQGSNFVIGRLKDFKNISLVEQIAYPILGLGFLLVLVSFILFIF